MSHWLNNLLKGGCGGNENNFETEDDCKNRCTKQVIRAVSDLNGNKCSLPKVTGNCRAAFRRFYFNGLTQKCERFIYGGCGGNTNNFMTESECTSKCASGQKNEAVIVNVENPNSEQKCTSPKDSGPCFASLERFFYNTESKQCEKFIYGKLSMNKMNIEIQLFKIFKFN